MGKKAAPSSSKQNNQSLEHRQRTHIVELTWNLNVLLRGLVQGILDWMFRFLNFCIRFSKFKSKSSRKIGIESHTLVARQTNRSYDGASVFSLTVSSCLAVSASIRLAKVTKPTGDKFLPFLFVTFKRLPS